MFIPSNITPPDQIQRELEEIQAFLEADYAADNPQQVQDRFDSLAGYMARSGKIKADAEYHLNTMVNSAIMDLLKKGYEKSLTPTVMNKFVDSAAKDYKFLVTWSDRCNRSCTHILEGMRSVMSTLRSERYANNYGRQ